MSPVVDSAGVFSVKMTGRPRIVMGGVSEPGWFMPPIQTGPPPVPTDNAMVASCGNVSIDAIHTAFASDVGNILLYMLTMFSHKMVPVACPDSLDTDTDAGQEMKPCGVPAPDSVMNATSSA